MVKGVNKVITLFNYLLVSSVFLGAFLLFTRPFDFCVSYIFILLFLIVYVLRYRRIDYSPTFLIIMLILTISSLANVWLGKDTVFLMMKEVLGILITGSAYYLLIKANKDNPVPLFRIYMQIALIVAIIGIFEEYSFLLGFRSGYDYGWFIQKWGVRPDTSGMLRLNSIFLESSHYAITMAPALFVSLSVVLKNKSAPHLSSWLGGMLIIISYILTFSVIAYLVIGLSLLLLLVNVRHLGRSFLLLMALVAAFYLSYHYEPEIRMRVDSTLGVVRGSIPMGNSHLSLYALTSNAYVAYKSFISDPVFGSGLGSHPVSYDRFILSGDSRDFWRATNYPMANKQDAASLLLRLLSETGLAGTVIVLYFIFKFRLRLGAHRSLSIISNAVFLLFIAQLLKQGHYFYNGLFFFVWVYYFVHQRYTQSHLKTPEPESH